jgi:hypothetical protein
MLCEIFGKDKAVLVIRMKLSGEEEPREVRNCEECLKKTGKEQ